MPSKKILESVGSPGAPAKMVPSVPLTSGQLPVNLGDLKQKVANIVEKDSRFANMASLIRYFVAEGVRKWEAENEGKEF